MQTNENLKNFLIGKEVVRHILKVKSIPSEIKKNTLRKKRKKNGKKTQKKR